MSAAVAYLDTSVLGRVVTIQPGSSVIMDAIASFDELVSSRLLQVELRRLGARSRNVERAESLLARVALLPIDDSVLAAAGTVKPANVGTLDAIHLVTALSVQAEARSAVLMTYDKRLAAAAAHHGLTVLTPA
jgi:uncharacterized protein